MAHAHAASWDSSGQGASRWGHWAPQILIAAIAATVLLAVRPLPVDNPLAALSPLLLVVVVVITWFQMRRHDRGLCELCVRAMPLNPSESAARYRRRLALAHAGSHRRVLVAYLAVLLGSDLLVAVAPSALQRPALMLWAAVQSTLVYLVLSHVTHRRLQPWCVQCGGRGDGPDDVVAPTPEPSDSLGR